VPTRVWKLTRRLNYREDTLTNARCLSKWLISLMLPPHLLENGNKIPTTLSFVGFGFQRFSHILLGRRDVMIGRLVR
jgi:hypothetical protein